MRVFRERHGGVATHKSLVTGARTHTLNAVSTLPLVEVEHGERKTMQRHRLLCGRVNEAEREIDVPGRARVLPHVRRLQVDLACLAARPEPCLRSVPWLVHGSVCDLQIDCAASDRMRPDVSVAQAWRYGGTSQGRRSEAAQVRMDDMGMVEAEHEV